MPRDGLLGLALLGFWVLLLVLLANQPTPQPPPAAAQMRWATPLTMTAPGTEFQSLGFFSGSDITEIARYTDSDHTLVVSAHARRDLLVCLRGDCRLVEEWLGK